MYEHLADQVNGLAENVFQKKIVVTQYPELAEHMKKRGFQVCLNDQPELGISHSVHLGAEEAWKWEPDAAICFAVSDQPYLRGTTLEMLIRRGKPVEKASALWHIMRKSAIRWCLRKNTEKS